MRFRNHDEALPAFPEFDAMKSRYALCVRSLLDVDTPWSASGGGKKLLLFVVRNAEKCVIYVGGRRGGEMRMIVEFIHVYGSMKKSRAIVLGGVCVCVWIMEGRIRCR